MRRTYRVVLWGPGEVGGAVAQAAYGSPDVRLVGAKVFSDRKRGADLGDLGDLVGLGPIGVNRTGISCRPRFSS